MLNYNIQLFKPAEFEIKVLWNEKACLKKKQQLYFYYYYFTNYYKLLRETILI